MPSEARFATGVLLVLALLGLLAPVLASDRPLLARVDGRLVAPALADLPLLGRILDDDAERSVVWGATGGAPPGVTARPLLMPPVPYSFRGVRLDEALQPPSGRHLLGTDALGRDLLARILHGARVSFVVGFGATGIALLLGFALGAIAALRGGLTDLLITRVLDLVACFPPFILALALMAALGRNGIWPMVAGIALSRWTGMARYVRGEILRHRGGEIWIAARAAGAGSGRLVLRHLLPLLLAPLAVMASFGVAGAIVLESGLSFLGYGVDPPAPSWGSILAEARATLDAAWWPVVFPSLVLLAVLAALCASAEKLARDDWRGL